MGPVEAVVSRRVAVRGASCGSAQDARVLFGGRLRGARGAGCAAARLWGRRPGSGRWRERFEAGERDREVGCPAPVGLSAQCCAAGVERESGGDVQQPRSPLATFTLRPHHSARCAVGDPGADTIGRSASGTVTRRAREAIPVAPIELDQPPAQDEDEDEDEQHRLSGAMLLRPAMRQPRRRVLVVRSGRPAGEQPSRCRPPHKAATR